MVIKDRIVVDCVDASSKNSTADIRNPEATRPWQDVLEPLSAYLSLAHQLSNDKQLAGEGFNLDLKQIKTTL